MLAGGAVLALGSEFSGLRGNVAGENSCRWLFL